MEMLVVLIVFFIFFDADIIFTVGFFTKYLYFCSAS